MRPFDLLCTGAVEEARRLAATRDGQDPQVAATRRAIARHDAVRGTTPLDGNDLRGWHYVLTGSLVLQLAPATAGTRGRYREARETPTLLRGLVTTLETLLQALDLHPPRVLALDTPGARVAGLIVAGQLGLGARNVLTSDEEGLVVADDFAAVPSELRDHHRTHRAGQPTFALAASARVAQPLTPDLVGYLYERRVPAWPVGDATPEAERARQALDADIPEEALGDDVGQLIALAVVAQQEGLLAVLDGEGAREPQSVGGPVALSAS